MPKLEPEVRPRVEPKVEPTSSRLQKEGGTQRNVHHESLEQFFNPWDSVLGARSSVLCPLWALCHNDRKKVSPSESGIFYISRPDYFTTGNGAKSFRSVSTKREISPPRLLYPFAPSSSSKFSNSSVPLQLFRHVRPHRTFDRVHTSALFLLRSRISPQTPGEKERARCRKTFNFSPYQP